MSKTPKTPQCVSCNNKLYVINIRREAIGYICPQCDEHIIKHPTKFFEKLANRIKETKKPLFKKRLVTICPICRKSKFVKCRKNTKRVFKKAGFRAVGFGPNTWASWCENPTHKKDEYGTSWGQNHPKTRMVRYY